jgi:hypothetical protein
MLHRSDSWLGRGALRIGGSESSLGEIRLASCQRSLVDRPAYALRRVTAYPSRGKHSTTATGIRSAVWRWPFVLSGVEAGEMCDRRLWPKSGGARGAPHRPLKPVPPANRALDQGQSPGFAASGRHRSELDWSFRSRCLSAAYPATKRDLFTEETCPVSTTFCLPAWIWRSFHATSRRSAALTPLRLSYHGLPDQQD